MAEILISAVAGLAAGDSRQTKENNPTKRDVSSEDATAFEDIFSATQSAKSQSDEAMASDVAAEMPQIEDTDSVGQLGKSIDRTDPKNNPENAQTVSLAGTAQTATGSTDPHETHMMSDAEILTQTLPEEDQKSGLTSTQQDQFQENKSVNPALAVNARQPAEEILTAAFQQKARTAEFGRAQNSMLTSTMTDGSGLEKGKPSFPPVQNIANLAGSQQAPSLLTKHETAQTVSTENARASRDVVAASAEFARNIDQTPTNSTQVNAASKHSNTPKAASVVDEQALALGDAKSTHRSVHPGVLKPEPETSTLPLHAQTLQPNRGGAEFRTIQTVAEPGGQPLSKSDARTDGQAQAQPAGLAKAEVFNPGDPSVTGAAVSRTQNTQFEASQQAATVPSRLSNLAERMKDHRDLAWEKEAQLSERAASTTGLIDYSSAAPRNGQFTNALETSSKQVFSTQTSMQSVDVAAQLGEGSRFEREVAYAEMASQPAARSIEGSPQANAIFSTAHARAETVRNVILQIMQGQSPSGGETIEIQLMPEELGKVTYRLATTETGVTIIVSAERDETLELLRRNSDQLLKEFAHFDLGNADLSFSEKGTGDEPQQDRALIKITDETIEQSVSHPPIQQHRLTGLGDIDIRL